MAETRKLICWAFIFITMKKGGGVVFFPFHFYRCHCHEFGFSFYPQYCGSPKNRLNFQGYDYTAVGITLKSAKWWISNELLFYHTDIDQTTFQFKIMCKKYLVWKKTKWEFSFEIFPHNCNWMEFRSCICIEYRRGFPALWTFNQTILKPNILALSIIINQLQKLLSFFHIIMIIKYLKCWFCWPLGIIQY